MLTASVSGSIFSSPPSSHILQAIRTVATEAKGILLVVPNYAGDVLNFGLAAERAKSEGIKVNLKGRLMTTREIYSKIKFFSISRLRISWWEKILLRKFMEFLQKQEKEAPVALFLF